MGLRIQIFSSWEIDIQKSTWERGLSRCSRILIGMLIEHDKELLSQTKTHIKSLETKLAMSVQEGTVTEDNTKLK